MTTLDYIHLCIEDIDMYTSELLDIADKIEDINPHIAGLIKVKSSKIWDRTTDVWSELKDEIFLLDPTYPSQISNVPFSIDLRKEKQNKLIEDLNEKLKKVRENETR